MMKKLIQALDFNGAQPQLSFFDNDLKFKTVKGGLVSIMIYSIGFAYFSYLMYMWYTYQIPPVVTNQLEFFPELRQFELVQPLFVLSLVFDQSQKKDLEKLEGKIYNVRSFPNAQESNFTLNPPGYDCQQQANDQVFYDPVCINLNDQYQTKLVQNFNNRSQDTYTRINVMHCDPVLDARCQSIKQQDFIYFELYPQWRFTLITQDVNIQTGAITNIPQDYFYYAYGYDQYGFQTLIFDLKVQKTTYIIDDGIIFPNLRYIEIVRSVDHQITLQNIQDQVTGSIIMASITYSLDRKEQVIKVTNPKLGQILAELGYTLQILLLFGQIMNKFNTSFMNAIVEDSLLKIYFPDFKLFDFRYNWRGQIKTIFNKGHILNKSDEQYMLILRKTLGKQVMSKLNYINILHELSRIQLLLQMQLPRKQIVLLQELGYRVKIPDKYIECKSLDGKFDESDQDLFLNYEQYEDFSRKLPLKKQQALQKSYTFGDSLLLIPSPLFSPKNSIKIPASLKSDDHLDKNNINLINESDIYRYNPPQNLNLQK